MLLVALALAFLVATSTARPNDEYRSAGGDDENGLSPEFRRFVEKFPDLSVGNEADIKLDGITMSPERIVITGESPSDWDQYFWKLMKLGVPEAYKSES